MTAFARLLMAMTALSLVMLSTYLSWYFLEDDGYDFPCTLRQLSEGRWVYRPPMDSPKTTTDVERLAGYHSRDSYIHRCYQRSDDFARSVAMLEYKWEPSMCQLVQVDPGIIAKYFSDHPILLVGDSVSEINYKSMSAMLSEHIVDPPFGRDLGQGHPQMWYHESVHRDKYNDPKAVSLAYIRSDYLVRVSDFTLVRPHDNEGPSIGRDIFFPWVQVVPQFDHIVLNSGLHWVYSERWGPHRSREELMTAFQKGMNTVFVFLKENIKPHQRVWYRSTPFGHGSCSKYTEPFDTTPVYPSPDLFNWDMLSSFDEVWRHWIEEQNDPRFQFLNISLLSNLRGDVHSEPDRDCMHTCIPGPVDDWSRHLFHEIAVRYDLTRHSFMSFLKHSIGTSP